jgi:peptidyl-prolyl cis-trans isomerase-like 4
VPTSDPDVRLAGSQFVITLGSNLNDLDGKAAVIGTVVEGVEVLDKLDSVIADESGWPLRDVRIKHTIVLDDPFPDPDGLVEPPSPKAMSAAQLTTVRIADDEDLTEETDPEQLEKLTRQREARAQALTLEMVGDLPFAEVKPPQNILFIAKLNPVTQDADLELIFSRFGPILSCEVIRDAKSGDSLQYAFIEFDKQEDCERAFEKMQEVLIDDHRILVDFSQSVSKLSGIWRDGENAKRSRKVKGGWGGVDNLEAKKQYRDEVERVVDKGNMMFDRRQNGGDGGEKKRERSRSPRREKKRERERSRGRDRDDRPRHRNDRDRDRDRDHHRRR